MKFLIPLLLFINAYAIEFRDFKSGNITYHWETTRYEEALEVYTAAFDKLYAELNVPDRESHFAFTRMYELELVQENPDHIKWLVAMDNDKMVGLCILELFNLPDIYIRELAVHPEYQKQGIGKKLTFGPIDETVRKITLVTRRINIPALDFYKNMGFQVSNFCHEDYDPAKYIGMEWLNPEWCNQ